jgi:hypothetical protein
MENQEAYKRAKRKVGAKVGFYIHLFVFLGVNLLLFIINLITSTGYFWFKWPLLGWSMGLFFHGISVFPFSGRKIRDLQEWMIAEEMQRESRHE